jgi:hypothetical protein
MYSDFTMMSAGQPRLTQKERFRQRFMHKLVYYPANNETWKGRMWDYGGKITWVSRDYGAGYPLQLTEEPKRRA